MPFLQTPGANISYRLSGQGPPVLLIQGVATIGRGWQPQLKGLSDRYRMAAFDNRGIGESLAETDALSIDAMAADALAVMDAVGFERAHIVGHSMGGLIAQRLALLWPARVRSLSLLCTFKTGMDATRLTRTMLLLALRARVGTRRMRRHSFLELLMPHSYLKQVDRAQLAAELGVLFGHDLADEPPITGRQLRAMGKYDASHLLGQLAPIPTLVVSASHDVIALPSYGRALAAAIPSARYLEIADAGHALPLQKADEINTLLAEHFGKDGVTSARS